MQVGEIMNTRPVELLRCRYQCEVCGDIIESNGSLVKCTCGAIGVDCTPGDPDLPRRMVGRLENFKSLCEWRLETGEVIYDNRIIGDS